MRFSLLLLVILSIIPPSITNHVYLFLDASLYELLNYLFIFEMSQILLYYICDDERNDDDNRKVVYVNNFHHYKHFQHPRIKYFCNPPKQDLYQNQKNNNHHLGNETCTLILRKISNPYGATHLLFWYGKLNITFLVIA